jgi:hypothetical protein
VSEADNGFVILKLIDFEDSLVRIADEFSPFVSDEKTATLLKRKLEEYLSAISVVSDFKVAATYDINTMEVRAAVSVRPVDSTCWFHTTIEYK